MPKYIDHLVPINNVCNQSCNFCSAEYRMKSNKPIPLKDIFRQILEKRWIYIQSIYDIEKQVE
jgi:MoaA/NifB/PqqE/SkfB family radical SAM enzyme